jgi:hypothetical protein
LGILVCCSFFFFFFLNHTAFKLNCLGYVGYFATISVTSKYASALFFVRIVLLAVLT